MSEAGGDNHEPVVGTTARDGATNRIGRVMAHEQGLVWLRPLDGGREWTARPNDIEPVSLSESLRPLVTEANRRSAEPR
ncbi:hypothetical protein [Streptomyces millisiae]|uniref:Uncharacterized protein n=1 Tax=Streptomyces millisiae TaxID=3075542 RepID=A0ABU2LXS8_9ACTN|nr:hypothetical protein [Streptomyces sp. DSM 44918]MDT0322397.1 hypothetical protein [Streptomyces sp. DSM 44918]